jgi:Transposase IS200 like
MDSACRQELYSHPCIPIIPAAFLQASSNLSRRAPIGGRRCFGASASARTFVATLDAVRTELAFLLMGWVLMPEHFHVLLKPEPADSTPKIVKQLKQRTASHILEALREHEQHP